jgi:hypothetical protein
MPRLMFLLVFCTSVASADTIITPSGTYIVSTVGSTTHVIQTATVPGSTSTWSPVMTAPVTGANTWITPSGTFMTSRVGSTVHVIQTSKGPGAQK